MTLQPLLDASPAIKIHTASAVLALVLGGAILWRRKGGAAHRLAGRVWVVLMMVTSFSAFFIHELKTWGDYSPIHILAVVTPISLVYAIMAIRHGDVQRHRQTMRSTYVGGLVLAGAFTLLPGRIMNKVVFAPAAPTGGDQDASWLVGIAGAILTAIVFWLWSRRDARRN